MSVLRTAVADVVSPTNRPLSPTVRPRGADAGGAVAARRLVRDIESLEATFAAAEQAALAYRPSRRGFNLKPDADVDSRRAELERWEVELQERERAMERQRTRVEQIQERLHRAKESLKRAIFRFRSEVAERSDELDTRSRQRAEAHAELVESRRELAREQIRQKAVARQTMTTGDPAA